MTKIDLKDIVSNSDNSREPAPVLQGHGYGVVEPVEGTGKPSLFALALGDPADQARYCRLIDQHQEGLAVLAQSIALQGQLQNCLVRPVSEGKYALTFGARRCLAVLYLHAKHGRPAQVEATVSAADGQAALIASAAENIHLPPSFIDQARLFQRLRDQGLPVKEIAAVYPMGKVTEQNIRHRLRLLELPPEVQLKVHHGKLSQDAALKLLPKKDVGSAGTPQQPPVAEPKGEATPPNEELQPMQGGGEPQDEEAPLRKGSSPSEDDPAGKDGQIQAILSDFVARLRAFDLDRFSPENLDELLRHARQAQKELAAIQGKASKGKRRG